MYCPQCGARLKDGSHFCTQCGIRLSDYQMSSPSASASLRESKTNPETQTTPNASRTAEAISAEQDEDTGAAKKTLGAFLATTVEFAGLSVPAFALPAAIAAVTAAAILVHVASSPDVASTETQAPSQEIAEQNGSPQQEDSSATQEVTCSFATQTESNGDNRELSYIQLTSTEPNDAIEKIDQDLKSREEAAKSSRNQTIMDEVDIPGSTASYRQSITYFNDGYLCVVESEYVYFGSAHGNHLIDAATIWDLRTGETVTPAKFVGLSDSDLEGMADIAAGEYLAAKGTSSSTSRPGVEAEPPVYALTADGIVAIFQEYELGPYSDGMPALVLCDLNGTKTTELTTYQLALANEDNMTGQQVFSLEQ